MVNHRDALSSLAEEFKKRSAASAELRFRNETRSLTSEDRVVLSAQLKATRRRVTAELSESLARNAYESKTLQLKIQQLDAHLRALEAIPAPDACLLA